MNNYKNLNDSKIDKPSSFKSTSKKTDSGMTKLTINIGRSDKLTPEMLLKLINKTIRSRNTEIGKINISKNYATFEIESKVKDMVISKMQHIRHDRKRILVSSYDEGTIDLPRTKNHKNKRRRNYNY